MIADLIAEGELTEEEGARGVENATKEYEKRLAVIEKTQEAEKKAAEEAQKRAQQEADQHKKRVDRLLEEQRIREEFGGSNQRFEADKNVTALQAEIALELKSLLQTLVLKETQKHFRPSPKDSRSSIR